MLLSIRQVEIEDEETGEATTVWQLANADGEGFGDVVRAVAMTGHNSIPRSKSHPALRTYDTREEAVSVAESLGRELAERHGGAFEIV